MVAGQAEANSQERRTLKTMSVRPNEESHREGTVIEVKPDSKIVNDLLNTSRNLSSKDGGNTSRHPLTSQFNKVPTLEEKNIRASLRSRKSNFFAKEKFNNNSKDDPPSKFAS